MAKLCTIVLTDDNAKVFKKKLGTQPFESEEKLRRVVTVQTPADGSIRLRVTVADRAALVEKLKVIGITVPDEETP